MKDDLALTNDLLELRKAFNKSFSVAPQIETEEMDQAVVFTLSKESYAINTNFTRVIIKIPHITKIPCAPSVIVGIINLNGVIVSVSDIRSILGVSANEITSESRIIVTKNLHYTTGILVDSIKSVVFVKQKDIQPPISTISAVKAELIQGEFYLKDKLVTLLNMERLSKSNEMKVE